MATYSGLNEVQATQLQFRALLSAVQDALQTLPCGVTATLQGEGAFLHSAEGERASGSLVNLLHKAMQLLLQSLAWNTNLQTL